MFEVVHCSVRETRETRGGLISGGLIAGWIFLFTGRWAYNRGGTYKRQFTVF